MNNLIKYFTIGLLLLSIKICVPSEITEVIPREPILYIEFDDISDFIHQFEASEIKMKNENSENYRDFTNSKLYMKLNARLKELSSVIDLTIDLGVIKSLGGVRTGFALYDIGELQFLMVTEVAPDKWLRSRLYDKTKYFESRTMGEFNYFVSQSDEGNMEFAFCEIGKRVFISNNLEYFLESLELAKNSGNTMSLNDIEKFKQFEELLKNQENREFYLYLKQSEINNNSYFKTYWIYQNFKDISWIDRALIFLIKEENGIKELRYFSSEEDIKSALPDIEPLVSRFKSEEKLVSIDLFEPVYGKICSTFFGNKKGLNKFVKDMKTLFEKSGGDYYMYLLSPIPVEEENFFYTYNKALFLHCGEGISNKEEWKRLVLELYRTQFVVPPGIAFQDIGDGGFKLDLPLTDGFYLQFKDDWVCFSNKQKMLDDISFPELPSSKSPYIVYLELDYQYLSDFTLQTVSKLVNKSNWSYYDSGEFFEDNISSLLKTTSRVKKFVIKQKFIEDFMEEEIRYFYE